MSNNHLICFLGRNTSGKSYRANQLVETKNYVKISMADSMRELLWKILGWRPITDNHYNIFKNSFISNYKDTHLDNYRIDNLEVLQFEVTGRQLLQNIGESCKEMFGQNFWVKEWERKVLDNILVIADDNYSQVRNEELLNKNYKVLHEKEDRGLLRPYTNSQIQNVTNEYLNQYEVSIFRDAGVKYYLTMVKFQSIVGTLIRLAQRGDKKAKKILDDNNISIQENNNIITTFVGRDLITTDDIRFPIEIEAAHRLGATFVWCDYQKGNYPEDNHPSEALANRILASGKYKDGEEISFEELNKFFE